MTTQCFADGDGDHFAPVGAEVEQTCECSEGFVALDPSVAGQADCDDAHKLIHVGATEKCDGVDNDCDGAIDEGVKTTCYQDNDGDKYALPNAPALLRCDCDLPNYTENNPNTGPADCNDSAGDRYPGASETCDGRDNDCDGAIDEGVKETCYIDNDGDGFPLFEHSFTWGSSPVPGAIAACTCPSNYVSKKTAEENIEANGWLTDKDDDNDQVYPGQTEFFDVPYSCSKLSTASCQGGFDYNCDGKEDQEVPHLRSTAPPCRSGFTGTVVPSCGDSARFEAIVISNCNVFRGFVRTQGCR